MSAIDLWVWGARYAALVHALRVTNGNRGKAGRILGVPRNWIYSVLRELTRPR